MRFWPNLVEFHRQIGLWSMRGLFCAMPSFVWAIFLGLSQPKQLAAMLAGVVTYVIAYAWIAALPDKTGQLV